MFSCRKPDSDTSSKVSFKDHRYALVELQTKLKSILKKKYKKKSDLSSDETYPIVGTDQFVRSVRVDDIHQHEFRQIEDVRWSPSPKVHQRKHQTSDLFECKNQNHFRTLLTIGVAGAGKTTHVNDHILNWAESVSNHDVDFVFPFSFWELNLLRKSRLNLLALIYTFYPELEDPGIPDLANYKVWFILDGLNECRHILDFKKTKTLTDVSEVSSVRCLLTNLILKNALVPHAHVWILSRQSAASRIPIECIGKTTEIQGFNDVQKEFFFYKAIKERALANQMVPRVTAAKRLHCLCQVPLIAHVCVWVFTHYLPTLPKCDCAKDHLVANLTRIYAGLFKASKMQGHKVTHKLEKLAAKQIEKGNMILYEEDLRENGITVEEATAHAKMNPLIFREEIALGESVFHFSHPSMLEFLAASFVMRVPFEAPVLKTPFLKKTVDKALGFKQGQLDVFIRFVVGIARDLVAKTCKDKANDYAMMVVEYFKDRVLENPTSDRCINLLYCLTIPDYECLQSQVFRYMSTRKPPMTPKHKACDLSFLAYQVLSVAGGQDLFEMDCSIGSDTNVVAHLPAIASAKKVQLRFCGLTDECCDALSTILGSDTSYLRDLDLSYSRITEQGLWQLNKGLKHPDCRLERLRLASCRVSPDGWAVLSLMLTQSRSLRALDLSGNPLGALGLQGMLGNVQPGACGLTSLTLSYCYVDRKSCNQLAGFLDTYCLKLQELDISDNCIEDDGLYNVLRSIKGTKIVSLILCNTRLTHVSCQQLGDWMFAFDTLRELDLSNNRLEDEGLVKLCKGMRKLCYLQNLYLVKCGLTDGCCEELCKTLLANPKYLRHLDLTDNQLGDFGVNLLQPALLNPESCLEVLRLAHCGLTGNCCATLGSALFNEPPSTLRELDLQHNALTDPGVRLLCFGLSMDSCKLESLLLRGCSLTNVSFVLLKEALESNPSYLKELHLMGNQFEKIDIAILMDLKMDPGFKLNVLDVEVELYDKERPRVKPSCCAAQHD